MIPIYALASDLPKNLGIGLNSQAFKSAVEKFQADYGDQMGFSLEDCKLTPLLPFSDSMKIGRAIQGVVLPSREDQIVLVGFKNDKVISFKQLVLPNFTWWVVKYNLRCSGNKIEVFRGKEKYFFNWDGEKLTAAKNEKKLKGK